MFNFESNAYIYGIGLLNGLLTLITILLLMRNALRPKASLVQIHEYRNHQSGMK